MSTNGNRVITIILAGIAIIWALLFSVTWGYKSYIKRHVPGWVAKGTDGIYQAAIDDVTINLFTHRITIDGVKLWADTNTAAYKRETGKSQKIAVSLSVPRVIIDGIVWGKLISRKELWCKKALIWQPVVSIIATPHVPDSTKLEPKPAKKPMLKKLFVETVSIVAPDIAFRAIDQQKNPFSWRLKGGTGTLNNWLLQPGNKDTTRFLLAETCVIDSSYFNFIKPSTLYNITAGTVFVNTAQKHVRIKDFSIKPTVPHDTFFKIIGGQTTIFTITARTVTLVNLDMQKLLHKKEFCADSIVAGEPVIDLYYSYLPPADHSIKFYKDPNRLLKKLPLKLHVKDITFNHAKVAYTELDEKSRREGTIYGGGLTFYAHNLTNIDSAILHNNFCTLQLKGGMMQKGTIDAIGRISLADTLGAFTLDATIKNLDAAQLRKAAIALTMIQLDTLQLDKLHAILDGNQNYVHGTLNLLYKDLAITMEKKKNNDSLKPKAFVSAVANNFFVYHDNPDDKGKLRMAETYISRDNTKAFFSMITRNVKEGSKKIIIRHEKIVQLLQHDTDKKKEKRGIFRRLFRKHVKTAA